MTYIRDTKIEQLELIAEYYDKKTLSFKNAVYSFHDGTEHYYIREDGFIVTMPYIREMNAVYEYIFGTARHKV